MKNTLKTKLEKLNRILSRQQFGGVTLKQIKKEVMQRKEEGVDWQITVALIEVAEAISENK